MSHGEVRLVNGKRIASPEYRSWQAMKNRCLNPRAQDYKYYGGRGIRVSTRWHNFDEFLADMGRRPTSKHTLERKNNNRHYTKRNCCWATRHKQAQNRRDTHFTREQISKIRKRYFTENIKQNDLAIIYKTSQAAISQIVRGAAWADVKGTTKSNSWGKNRPSCKGELNGRAKITNKQTKTIKKILCAKTLTQKTIAARFGVTQATISRIYRGLR